MQGHGFFFLLRTENGELRTENGELRTENGEQAQTSSMKCRLLPSLCPLLTQIPRCWPALVAPTRVNIHSTVYTPGTINYKP